MIFNIWYASPLYRESISAIRWLAMRSEGALLVLLSPQFNSRGEKKKKKYMILFSALALAYAVSNVSALKMPTTGVHPLVGSSLPPQITSTTPGTWAHDTMSRRVESEILARLEGENEKELSTPAFGAARKNIRALREEIQRSDNLRLVRGAEDPDIAAWEALVKPLVACSETYLTAPWLTAEFYVYRRVMECFDYFNKESATYMFDPFVKQKRAGLQSSVASAEALLGRFAKLNADEAGLGVAIFSALWGNKMDLSIWPADAEGGSSDVFSAIFESASDNLLWDDSETLIKRMLSSPQSSVHIIVDNAGFE